MKKHCLGCGVVVDVGEKMNYHLIQPSPVKNNDLGGSVTYPHGVVCGKLVPVAENMQEIKP